MNLETLQAMTHVPGFGGSTPAPPPPPPAPTPVPKKTDPQVRAARDDQVKRSKLASGQAGTNKQTGALEPATVANKVLLT